jgi:hypothetical protein
LNEQENYKRNESEILASELSRPFAEHDFSVEGKGEHDHGVLKRFREAFMLRVSESRYGNSPLVH